MNDTDTMGELILFKIGALYCGVDILHVQEIKKIASISRVYGAAPYIRGVINLRGQIVTIFDVRSRFGVDELPLGGEQRGMIVPWRGEQVGLLVDQVEDIITIDPDKLTAVPSNMDKRYAAYFSNVYRTEEMIISILDVETLLDTSKE